VITFANNKHTKFCQITLHIKRSIPKRKAVPFYLPHGVNGHVDDHVEEVWLHEAQLTLTTHNRALWRLTATNGTTHSKWCMVEQKKKKTGYKDTHTHTHSQ